MELCILCLKQDGKPFSYERREKAAWTSPVKYVVSLLCLRGWAVLLTGPDLKWQKLQCLLSLEFWKGWELSLISQVRALPVRNRGFCLQTLSLLVLLSFKSRFCAFSFRSDYCKFCSFPGEPGRSLSSGLPRWWMLLLLFACGENITCTHVFELFCLLWLILVSAATLAWICSLLSKCSEDSWRKGGRKL